MNPILRPWVRFFDVRGRSSRTEYLLFHVIVVAAIGGLIYLGVTTDPLPDGGISPAGDKFLIAAGIVFLAAIVPAFTLAARRLHDQDLSGWMVLLAPIPAVNLYVGLICSFAAGSEGWNSYGPDPRDPGSAEALDDPALS